MNTSVPVTRSVSGLNTSASTSVNVPAGRARPVILSPILSINQSDAVATTLVGSSVPPPVVSMPRDGNVAGGSGDVQLLDVIQEEVVCDNCGKDHRILVCQERKPWEYVPLF